MSSERMVDIDKAVQKWLKWVVILLLAKVRKPFSWSTFLSVNPLVRKVLENHWRGSMNRDVSGKAREYIDKVSNVVTCFFLYQASLDNGLIPKDYMSIYIWLAYFGTLNAPARLDILVSRFSWVLKPDYYKSDFLKRCYANKEFVIFPVIFAQVLSNYLTPTKYRLNHKYLSGFIKNRILNPIWLNYSQGARTHSVNWARLGLTYVVQNLVLMLAVGVFTFKKRILDQYYAINYGVSAKKLSDVVKSYILYCFHKANSYVNFIYFPNLMSIFLISLTSPLLAYLGLRSTSMLHLWYTTNTKLFFKGYIKTIGFVSAFTTLCINSMNFIPDYGYKLDDKLDKVDKLDQLHTKNIRLISKDTLDAINLYIFRLIILQKWRIMKGHHPLFRVLKLESWNKLETLLMCFGVYKLMSLNDYVKTTFAADDKERKRIELDSMIKAVDKIMH